MNYRVREIRKNKGMTQEELSEKSGISRQTIIAIENGVDYVATTMTLKKLADALECSIGEIFCCNE